MQQAHMHAHPFGVPRTPEEREAYSAAFDAWRSEPRGYITASFDFERTGARQIGVRIGFGTEEELRYTGAQWKTIEEMFDAGADYRMQAGTQGDDLLEGLREGDKMQRNAYYAARVLLAIESREVDVDTVPM